MEATSIELLREFDIMDHSIEKFNLSEEYRNAYTIV
jgi:hypothetical protein